MKRKYWLIVASIIMIIIGLLRGLGGISLLLKGNQLNTASPIIANKTQIIIVAFGLLLICGLLIYASIHLIRKYLRKSWNFCWIILVLFLIDGLLNGFILFGQPLDQGQKINVIAVLIVGLFLVIGKPSLKDAK